AGEAGEAGNGEAGNGGGGLPRLLVVMGSGETSPTMVKVHRATFARLGPTPVPAVVLDTPFGFQENADDIVARAQSYFRDSVGATLGVASFRRAGIEDPVERARFVQSVSGASFVFAGPGSPTYALGVWAASALPSLLADKLRVGGVGGAITFASAAALTLGVATVPVYEIYKAGSDPHWLAGLDLLALAGLSAAVIPHYNNAEGGNHDTRFCYLGERRLAGMEDSLPEGSFVLGVDEHTGLVLDLEEGSASVVGLGVVTVRAKGSSATFGAGQTLPITDLAQAAEDLARGGSTTRPATRAQAGAAGVSAGPVGVGVSAGPVGVGVSAEPGTGTSVGPGARAGAPSLAGCARERREAFDTAVGDRDANGAVRAILALDDDIVAWSRDTLQSDEADRARDTLHSMVLSLGQLAKVGARDQREVVGPFVEALLEQRSRARATRRFEDADALRDQLTALGVEVRDTPGGVEWLLEASPAIPVPGASS
ncbi:MAG: CysS/YqeB C-terminal domain-containing protein, partial [Acidimicrobiales bacterium]